MKKLMKAVTASAVALVASGAFASLPSPTEGALGFEAFTAGKYTVSDFVEMTDEGQTGSGNSRYWYAITNASQDASAELATIVEGGAAGGNKYLAIEAQAPLYRTINASGNWGPELSDVTAEDIPASGIYLDTMVKFTVSSDEFKDGDLDIADKLAITCYSADDSGATNIIVRAGYVGSSVVATNYVMTLPDGFDVDAWHRLTVRAIADVGSSTAPVGFAVYLDQVLLTYGNDVAAGGAAYVDDLNPAVTQNLYNSTTHALLPSLVTTGVNKSKLTAVGFKGTGSLDDIQFTNEKPSFIVEGIAVSIAWDANVATYTVVDSNNKTLVDAATTSGAAGSTNLTLDAGVTTLTVTATYANGYEAGTWTVTGDGAQISGSAFTVANGAELSIVSMLPKFDVGGTHYDSFEAALEAAVASQTPATLKLLANCNQVLGFPEGCVVILDLNGCDIQGGADADCSILNNGATLVITNSGDEASVKLPTNPLADPGITLMTVAGQTTIQAGTFDGLVIPGEGENESRLTTITGGKFLDTGSDFYLAGCVAQGVSTTKSGNYVIVGAAEPEPATFELTTTGGANATVTTAPVDVSALTEATSVTITATATSDYTYFGVDLSGTWTYNSANDAITRTLMVSETTAVPVPNAVEKTAWAKLLGNAVGGAYLIDNLTELKAFQANVGTIATADETFKLTDDIELDAAWDGIGLKNGKDSYSTDTFNAKAFCGTFDGQNHTISGFQMVGVAGNPDSTTEGLDYCGFFNSTYGATIQNLKIAYAGSLFAEDTTASTKESGATFVGVAKNSTLKNLTTVAGTVSSSKGFGGIVGYLTSGSTVDSCTNNLNMTSLANNKCGGIAMITQGGSAVTIRNCQNNGTQTTGSSNSEYGAIVGYVGLDVTIENCETTVGRFLKHQGNTVTLQGVNKGDATVLSYHGAATPGLNFATVDGSVATFVADDALAAGNTYKVMATGATATYEFTAAGTISFNTNLTQDVTFAITAAQESGLEVTDATVNGVVTFTAAVPPVVPGSSDGNTYDTAEAAAAAAADVEIGVPADVTTADIDAATYKAMFEAKVVENNNGTYSVVVDLKPAVETAVQTAVDKATVDTLEDVLTADGASASVTVTTKPGLYYQIVTGNALPLAEPDAKNWTMATGDSTSITVTKPAGNAAFFKVHCTPAK